MIRCQKGLTLIEVLIVSVVLVLVLSGVYTFYFSGQKTFRSGAEQVELHTVLRLAAENISRELRFAEELRLMEEGWDPGSASTDDCSYIYFDPGSGTVQLLDDTGSHTLSGPEISELTFSPNLERDVLLFTIKGESSSEDFTLESSVKPMNMGKSERIGGPGAARALSFSLPQ